jgi:hypothetical protein
MHAAALAVALISATGMRIALHALLRGLLRCKFDRQNSTRFRIRFAKGQLLEYRAVGRRQLVVGSDLGEIRPAGGDRRSAA